MAEAKRLNPFKSHDMQCSASSAGAYLEAFTSDFFRVRVNKGLERVLRFGVESGFAVLRKDKKIYYPPLVRGSSDSTFSLVQSSYDYLDYTIPDLPRIQPAWVDRDKIRYLAEGFSVIGTFHFHTWNDPFSNFDLESWEEQQVIQNEDLSYANDRWEGLFNALVNWDGSFSGIVRLFMFSGSVYDHSYQALDFERIRFNRQREALEASGLKTVLVDLPTRRNAVNLEPLKLILSEALENYGAPSIK